MLEDKGKKIINYVLAIVLGLGVIWGIAIFMLKPTEKELVVPQNVNRIVPN